MNILFLANHFNPGGISSYIINLSKGLSAKGHNIYVGSSGGEWEKRLGQLGINHIDLPLRTKSIASPKLIFSYFALRKTLRQRKIDIIHSNTRVTSVLSSWISAKAKVPYVSTAHGFFKARWERRIFPCWGKAVIAISEAVREHLINDFRVNKDRIRLVHNGIAINPAPAITVKQRQRLKGEFGLGSGPVVGIVARLSEVKGHKYLIMAMKDVIDKIPGAQLLIVGDGRIKGGLESLADGLKIRPQVHFIPAVSDTAVIYSLLDVFVMPSLQEGLGLSIMEAMSAGVAVAASDVGGIGTLIKDGLTGILVSPGDTRGLTRAVINLLNDNEFSGLLALRAREFICKEFSLEKMSRETEKVFLECLN